MLKHFYFALIISTNLSFPSKSLCTLSNTSPEFGFSIHQASNNFGCEGFVSKNSFPRRLRICDDKFKIVLITSSPSSPPSSASRSSYLQVYRKKLLVVHLFIHKISSFLQYNNRFACLYLDIMNRVMNYSTLLNKKLIDK